MNTQKEYEYAAPPESALADATVQIACEDKLVVAGRFGLARATRAAGCLLAPEAGDRVLLAFAGEEVWVLSVLARAADANPGRLALPAHTVMRTRRLELSGDVLELRAGVLFATGKLLAESFGVLRRGAGKLLETALRRHVRYGKNREETRETSEVSVGRLRLDCRHSARMRAENMDIRASELLDLDGSHIKVG
ncbi:MAG: DUF3540 domain-containing protein [Candidatus Accumulibacter sp.]|jgi:hypothetical protein|nr:DUF3540 domain-containing protein [Accumulibacter sp.]